MINPGLFLKYENIISLLLPSNNLETLVNILRCIESIEKQDIWTTK